MSSFSVDPVELDLHGAQLSASEPFGPLADAAAGLVTISEPAATTAALQRFTDRIQVDLRSLALAAGSLSRATRLAASDYQAVEGSIASQTINPPQGVP